MSEEEIGEDEIVGRLRDLWLRHNSPLHRLYSSWNELLDSIVIKNEPSLIVEDSEHPKEIIESKTIKEEGTGGLPNKTYKDVVYHFDPYEITVRLSQNNEFIAITKVNVKKDFISYKKKISTKGYHDVEAFYPE